MTTKIDIDQYFDSKPSAWKENREFAKFLMNKIKPDVTLDLGVDWGHSTSCWAENGCGRVYGVDTWEPNSYSNSGREFHTTLVPAFKSFNKQGLNNIELSRGRHEQVNETWDREIDILHFDILHTYDGLVEEYNMWKKFVRPRGVMLFHDVISFPDGVGRFIQEYLTGKRLSFNNQFGLGVISDDHELLDSIAENFSVTILE